MSQKNWAVFRLDFSANEFLVEKNLTQQQAEELVAEYEAKKHHQHYWCCQWVDEGPDFEKLLRDSLHAGSSI